MNRVEAIKGADLEGVLADLAGREHLQLVAFPSVPAPGVTVRARLHRHRVRVLAHHPPYRVVSELVDAKDLVHPDAEVCVDDSDGDCSGWFGNQLVLETCFRETGLRRGHRLVALD